MKGYASISKYFIEVIPFLSKVGINGILLEWEDMLPYQDDLLSIKSDDAYNRKEVETITLMAYNHNIEIIPLLPTLDGLEFLLKHRNFSKLRGNSIDVESICPSNDQSLTIIYQLLDQILLYHPYTKRVHIGGTIGNHFNSCNLCKQENSAIIYFNYLEQIVSYLAKYDIKVMIWDKTLLQYIHYQQHKTSTFFKDDTLIIDSIRQLDLQLAVVNTIPSLNINQAQQREAVTEVQQGEKVVEEQQEVRNLNTNVLDKSIWQLYSKISTNIYGAASFKHGTTINDHLYHDGMKDTAMNIYNWLKLADLLPIPLQGMIFTGFSRNSHFEVLKQSLPETLPSLLLALKILNVGTYNDELYDTLSIQLGLYKNTTEDSSNMSFPGQSVYNLMKELHILCSLSLDHYERTRKLNILKNKLNFF